MFYAVAVLLVQAFSLPTAHAAPLIHNFETPEGVFEFNLSSEEEHKVSFHSRRDGQPLSQLIFKGKLSGVPIKAGDEQARQVIASAGLRAFELSVSGGLVETESPTILFESDWKLFFWDSTRLVDVWEFNARALGRRILFSKINPPGEPDLNAYYFIAEEAKLPPPGESPAGRSFVFMISNGESGKETRKLVGLGPVTMPEQHQAPRFVSRRGDLRIVLPPHPDPFKFSEFSNSLNAKSESVVAPETATRALGAAQSGTDIAYKNDVYQTIVREASEEFSEVVLRRNSDGKEIRVAVFEKWKPVPVFPVVKDGIVSFSNFKRRIDLDRFDAEARFRPKPNKQIKAGMGAEVEPEELVKSLFTDYVELARLQSDSKSEIEIDPTIFKRIREGLAQAKRKNVALLGPAGVGKSTIIEEFSRKIALGEFPEIPRTTRVFVFNASELEAGTGTRGDAEARIAAFLAVARNAPTIFIVDEVHNLRGSGTHSGKSTDLLQSLKPAMANGELALIGMSTSEEFHQAFASDTAFVDRFTTVDVAEPQGEALVKVIRQWMLDNGFTPPKDSIIRKGIEFSNEYDAIGAQPRKATKLWEKFYASQLLRNEAGVPTLKALYATAAELYGVDRGTFNPKLRNERIEALDKALEREIVGHNAAKAVLHQVAMQSLAGLEDGEMPKGRVLFAGSKGVGKTTIAKAFANGMNVPYARIDMTAYRQNRTPEAFLQEIAGALRKNAHSVLLFDELEKADPAIQNTLISILDEGSFTVLEQAGSGMRAVKVSARNAFVLVATNAGQDYIDSLGYRRQKESIGFVKQEPEKAPGFDMSLFKRVMVQNDSFSEFVLDRMTFVVPMFSQNFEEYREIARRSYDELLSEFKRKGYSIKIDNENRFLEEWSMGFRSKGESNRALVQALRTKLNAVTAELIFDGRLKQGGNAELAYHGGGVFQALPKNPCERLMLSAIQ